VWPQWRALSEIGVSAEQIGDGRRTQYPTMAADPVMFRDVNPLSACTLEVRSASRGVAVPRKCKIGLNVLFCKPNRTNCILMASVMHASWVPWLCRTFHCELENLLGPWGFQLWPQVPIHCVFAQVLAF
jgi:hypothetical protein